MAKDRKTFVNKSRAGHYSVTMKALGFSVTINKLDSLSHVDIAKAEAGIRLDRLILAEAA